LENIDGDTIIASLPTSQQYVDDKNLKKGAIEQGFTKGYFFPKNEVIGKNNRFSFKLNTFVLFRSNVFKESINAILRKYPKSNITVLDTLLDQEFQNLIYAMYKSDTLPPYIENIFEKLLDEIIP
jgi:hypothetical protein